MIRVKVKLQPQALKAARERFRGLAAKARVHRVTVGLHDGHAGDAKLNYRREATKARLALVAAVQEFGAGNMPSRSWLRDWFDTYRGELEQRMVTAMRLEYADYKSGAEASGPIIAFAQAALTAMVNRIKAGIMPPLSPKTAAARVKAGLSEDPALMATGQLVDAMTANVDGRLEVFKP